MKSKATVVLIDDKKLWLSKISDLIVKYFEATIDSYSNFEEAEKRLLETPLNLDLLITDVFPTDEIDETATGLEFVKFVESISSTPMIVITGRKNIVNSTFKEYNVLDVFYKGDFNAIPFINVVQKAIGPYLKSAKESPKGNNPGYVS